MPGPAPRLIDLGNPANLAHPLLRGLLAWWLPLPNTAGGSKVYDLSGHGRHATFGGSTTFPTWRPASHPGRTDRAIDFDGTDDVMTAGAISDITGATALTIACWMYPRSGGGVGFGRLFHSDDANPFAILMNGSATSMQFTLNGGFGIVTGTVTATAWNHLIGAWDGTTMTLYVNGVSAGTAAFSTALGTCSTIYFGDRSSGGRAFDGTANDFVIWNRGLSAAGAALWYDQARRGHPDTLRRYTPKAWSFGGAGVSPPPPPAFNPGWATGATRVIGSGGAA